MALIILVEDTLDQLTLMTQALKMAGFEVLPCRYFYQGYKAITDNAFNPELAAILSDSDLGTDVHNGQTIYAFAHHALVDKIPFIGSSFAMKDWENLAALVKDPNLYLIPKNNDGWDIPAVLAKLAELGITP